MAQIIQIKRRIPGTGKPNSGTGANEVRAGELATAISATGAAGVADLFIGDGTYVHDLVSNARQVEIAGPQTITGAKTIGAAGSLTTPVANIHIQGGAAGNFLTTDGSGVNSWAPVPAAGIPGFSATENYPVGSFVTYGGHIYRATAANGPGAWTPGDWDRVATVSDIPVIEVGTTAPTPAVAGDLWFNTTTQQLMAYNGTAWVLASRSYVGTTAPATPASGTTWFDTTAGQNILKVWNGTAWVPAVDQALNNFSATETYAVGDLVIHNGHIYRAGAANGPGAWDGDDWDQITGTGLESLLVSAPISGNGLGTALGVTPATTTQIDTGTDNVFPITSAGLRHEVGAAPSTLTTTAKTIVPAINELAGQVAAVSGAVRFAGTYDVPGDDVDPVTPPIVPAGNLQQASAANEGAYLIVTDAGLGVGHAPHVQMAVGDWIVSTGAAWVHVPLHHAATTAQNVGITTINAQTWTNVQDALAGIYARAGVAGNTAVLADHVSVLGDGTSTTPLTASVGELRVGLVDGGTF